jgi:cyanate lyase
MGPYQSGAWMASLQPVVIEAGRLPMARLDGTLVALHDAVVQAVLLRSPRLISSISHHRGLAMIHDRKQVTEMILSAKVSKGIKWVDVAAAIGLSKEWTTAGCLGQMTFDKTQAETIGRLFDLSDQAIAWLQIVPSKGSLSTAVPTDPLTYRLYEIVSVYGSTIKELIHEEFGDGIMSAIDFSMDIQRAADPKGDRVNLVMSGKFLGYKSY